MTRPCPFCGESKLTGLTHGHKEGCFFDLMLFRGISEQEHNEAFDRRVETLSSAVAIMQQDNRLQFTRADWDSLGVATAFNRVLIQDGELIYCTWDGVQDEYRPTLEDIAATDWRVL
jgi:hypothetical protein